MSTATLPESQPCVFRGQSLPPRMHTWLALSNEDGSLYLQTDLWSKNLICFWTLKRNHLLHGLASIKGMVLTISAVYEKNICMTVIMNITRERPKEFSMVT